MQRMTKEKFCKCFDRIQAAFDADAAVEDVRRKCKSEFLASDLSFLSGELVETMALAMDVDTAALDYFIFDLNFGRSESAKNCRVDYLDPEEKRWVEAFYDLSSAEKLYDYLTESKDEGLVDGERSE